MLLSIIGFILCVLGGGIIGGVVAQIDNNAKEMILSWLAIICLMIGTTAVVL